MREHAEELKNETNKEKRRMEKYNHAGDDVKMMKNDKVENSWNKRADEKHWETKNLLPYLFDFLWNGF